MYVTVFMFRDAPYLLVCEFDGQCEDQCKGTDHRS